MIHFQFPSPTTGKFGSIMLCQNNRLMSNKTGIHIMEQFGFANPMIPDNVNTYKEMAEYLLTIRPELSEQITETF